MYHPTSQLLSVVNSYTKTSQIIQALSISEAQELVAALAIYLRRYRCCYPYHPDHYQSRTHFQPLQHYQVKTKVEVKQR